MGSAVAVAIAATGGITAGITAWSPGHTAAVSQGAATTHGAASQLGTTLSRTAAPRSQPPRLDALLATSAKPKVISGGGRARRVVRLTPRQIARRLFRRFHWSHRQFRYLNPLWERESSWNVRAFNAYSGAYGIPQAVPGSKMASAGPNWQASAHTQILWGLRYIKAIYGSPRGAWDHELATGWY